MIRDDPAGAPPTVRRQGFRLIYRTASGADAMSFPCDANGEVPINDLTEPMRVSYLAARALVGYAYRLPVVRALPQA